eukprot:6186017-Pleurochrysis_carterae.AAC.2
MSTWTPVAKRGACTVMIRAARRKKLTEHGSARQKSFLTVSKLTTLPQSPSPCRHMRQSTQSASARSSFYRIVLSMTHSDASDSSCADVRMHRGERFCDAFRTSKCEKRQ